MKTLISALILQICLGLFGSPYCTELTLKTDAKLLGDKGEEVMDIKSGESFALVRIRGEWVYGSYTHNAGVARGWIRRDAFQDHPLLQQQTKKKQEDEETKEEADKVELTYKVEKLENVSYSNVVRFSYRIRVNREVTEDEIRSMCEVVLKDLKQSKPHNAVAFFFYLPGTHLMGHFTAGKAEWCPFGDWGKAGEVKTGDYSKHKLTIEVGNAVGDVPESDKANVPLETKKKIFYQLVQLEDGGMKADAAESYLAKKYSLNKETITKIKIEGAISGWPMPPVR